MFGSAAAVGKTVVSDGSELGAMPSHKVETLHNQSIDIILKVKVLKKKLSQINKFI